MSAFGQAGAIQQYRIEVDHNHSKVGVQFRVRPKMAREH